jgi:PAS domain S-box-containing protein
MTDNKSSSNKAADLRRRADEMLRQKADQSPQDLASLSPEEIRNTLHELRVHQIELEMQNEELQRTQFELKTARERYFNLYDLAPVGYVTLSEKGLILEANLTAARLLGVARGALVKQPLSRFVLKEDQDIYYLHRKQLFENGEPQGYDLRMVKKDGTRFWAHVTGTAAQDGEGAPVCRAVISDITGRKQAEEALLLSEERYRTVADYTYDWEYWQAADGSILYMSPSCERITGYRADEFVAKPGLLDEITHPDDTSLIEQHLSRVQQNGDEPKVHEVDFRILRKEGAVRWIGHICQRIRKEDGTNLGRRVSNRDITGRKQAEAKINMQFALLNAVGQAVIATDMNGTVTYLNRATEELYGWAASEAVGRNIMEVTVPDISKSQAEEIMASLTNGLTWSGEFMARRRDGTVFPAIVSDAPVLDETGKLIGIIGISMDISERKQAEEALRQSEEKFRLLFEKAPLGYQSLDSDGKFLEINQTWLEMLGYTRDEVIGHWFGEFLAPDFVEGFRKRFPLFKAAGKIHSEFEMLHKNGSRHFIAFEGLIGYKLNGDFKQTHCILQDITERKQAEDALASQRQTYEQILEQSLAGYWDWDIPTGDEYLSPTFKKMFGYEDHEIENRAESWQRLIFAEDLPGVYEKYNQHCESKGEIPFYNEVRYHHKNGSTVWVICTGKVIEWDDDRKAKRMIGCHIDITERKQAELSLHESEARFKAVSEYSHNAICLIDESGKIIWINDAFIKMSGYSKDQIYATTSFIAYLAPESIPFVVENFTRFVKHEPYEHHYNFYFVNADGQKRLCEKHMTDYEDNIGNRILALSMLDITDGKLAEEKINKQLEELRRWHNITLGREDRIMELKREVNKLLAEAGKPPHYASVAEVQDSRGEKINGFQS